ncbi:MAG: hypothetical protein ACLP2Y_19380 [Limisphaerales bacterium]|jgi:hypothetical protein
MEQHKHPPHDCRSHGDRGATEFLYRLQQSTASRLRNGSATVALGLQPSVQQTRIDQKAKGVPYPVEFQHETSVPHPGKTHFQVLQCLDLIWCRFMLVSAEKPQQNNLV